MANNRTYERLLVCWKGKFPAGGPKERQFVDAGSAVYEDAMLRVHVLHPKDLTYIEQSVLDQSLKTMIGLCEEPQVTDSAADFEVADSAAPVRPLQENVKSCAFIGRHQKRRWCGFRMTTTPICSRSLFGNPAAPAGSCMARQRQAQASWAAWRQACLSSPYVRTLTTRHILASR